MKNDLLKQALTPAYVFSADELLGRIRMMQAFLGSGVRLVYAVKANPFLIRTLRDAADGFEVCSPGEVRLCIRSGIPPEKLIISGVNKEPDVYADFVRNFKDLPVYTAESPAQMNMLNAAALRYGTRIRVLLRLSGGNQFGMDEKTLREQISQRENFPGLVITGIQQYTGTQKRSRQILREIARFDDFLCSFDFLTEAEYGPGLPVSYFTDETDLPDEELLKPLSSAIAQMRFTGRITLEIGRFLAAHCGYYLTKVTETKCNDGGLFAITDGGIHQMNYYHQFMGMKNPHMRVLGSAASPQKEIRHSSRESDNTGNEIRHWTVCGSLCTVSDILVRDLPLPLLEPDDLLVFERTGAYSVTEGISLFLSRDLPRIYLCEEGNLKLIRDKILTEDLNYGRTDPVA